MPSQVSMQPGSLSFPDRGVWVIRRCTRGLPWAMLGAAAVLFVLHFPHLKADFPADTPWMDWSKYTDEGWYGDAAIRHFLFGHWYWKGDFNPAVALPVWPLMEAALFRCTGVSVAAARALTLAVFGTALTAFYLLVAREARPRQAGGTPLAAALAVLLLCASPYFYVFERMAILEPLVIALTALALLAASHLQPLWGLRDAARPPGWRAVATAAALGLLLPAMVLTKTTAIFLMPAVAYMVWARAGYRLKPALRLAAVPAAMAAVIWGAYFFLLVRPHYLEDYRYLFSANAYTGVELEPLATVVLNTISDGIWMGKVLYPLFFVILALALFWRPGFFTKPLVPALLLWTGGYFAFLAYHNNLQPRYYTVVAAPMTVFVAMGLDYFRQGEPRRARWTGNAVAAVLVCAIVLPDVRVLVRFVRHPEYQFLAALEGVARVVRATPGHSPLVLSISGSDLTLMTGLPSIDDDFGTLKLPERVRQYRPGWYAAWNALDDIKMDALRPLYTVRRVADFPAYDDPERNLLILYRLDPVESQPTEAQPTKVKTPKALVTKMGQQPSTRQLQH